MTTRLFVKNLDLPLDKLVAPLKIHTAHSTQHTAHSTQHTAHSTQHTAHSTQHTAHSISVNSARHSFAGYARFTFTIFLSRKQAALNVSAYSAETMGLHSFKFISKEEIL